MEAFGTRFTVVSNVEIGNPNEVLSKEQSMPYWLSKLSNFIPTCLNIHRV